MNNASLYRIGGIAAILSIVLSFGAMAVPALLAVSSLALAVFIFALHRLFNSYTGPVGLVAAIGAIIGAIALAVMSIPAGAPTNSVTALAAWAAWFLPPLVFGFLALRHSEAGMSRPLAIIGIMGGVFGLINLVLTLIAGGNWQQPNNPALTPVIMATYYIGMLFTLVWLVWTGIVLLRRRA